MEQVLRFMVHFSGIVQKMINRLKFKVHYLQCSETFKLPYLIWSAYAVYYIQEKRYLKNKASVFVTLTAAHISTSVRRTSSHRSSSTTCRAPSPTTWRTVAEDIKTIVKRKVKNAENKALMIMKNNILPSVSCITMMRARSRMIWKLRTLLTPMSIATTPRKI